MAALPTMPKLALYVSAARRYDLDAIRNLMADAVIIDLEASVPTDAKDAARVQMVRWLSGPTLARTTLVRINDLASALGAGDLTALAGMSGIAAIVLPQFCAKTILPAPFDTRPLWAMIESVDGLTWLESDDTTPDGLTGIIIGYKDLADDLGVAFDPASEVLGAIAMRILAAGRARRLACFDGVSMGDAGTIEAATIRGLQRGFDGLTYYAPAHLEIAQRAIADRQSTAMQARRNVDNAL